MVCHSSVRCSFCTYLGVDDLGVLRSRWSQRDHDLGCTPRLALHGLPGPRHGLWSGPFFVVPRGADLQGALEAGAARLSASAPVQARNETVRDRLRGLVEDATFLVGQPTSAKL